MKIIITGATGFVGKNLVQSLESEGFDCISVSLRDIDWQERVMQKATGLIHLAGKAHDTTNTSSSDEYFSINRDLTILLFKSFLRSDIRDFYFFSSVKAIADTVDDILKEDTVAYPKTPYGKSKLEAEQYLTGFNLPKGKRLFVIRPCMIHGPGNKGNLNLLYSVVEKGVPWPLASFSNQRSFLGIENLCFLINKMLEDKSIDSGVYNFSDDETMSTNDLVRIISTCNGKPAKLIRVPRFLISMLAKIGDLLSLPLNSERLKKLTESYVVSNEKIKGALKIDHLPLSTKQGIERTVRSFSRNTH